ncbi:MAG: ATP-dependent helicase, partial [Paucimonas sp.]|nr:ATP-dependent helicase [Paucimonas sp.]
QLEQEGVKATAIHGDKSQAERMAALEAFKNGSVDVLVATDVAARGLDIAELPCVINYDLPYNAEDYVHLIGRTGRAGASGDAISLCTDKDVRLLTDIEKLIRTKFNVEQLTGFVGGGHHARPRREEASYGSSPRREERAPGSSARGSSAGSSSGSSYAPGTSSAPRSGGRGSRPEKVDPWFLKPYEPEAPTVPVAGADNEEATAGGNGNGKQPKRAALLGGLTRR